MSASLPTGFSRLTTSWFNSAFEAPTAAQQGAWEAIARGEHTLVVAPTGSGKTLAAFLWALDQCASAPRDGSGVRVLYVSPLKALATDVARNLRGPLAGIRREAARAGLPEPEVSVAVRSGDTTAAERAAMVRKPPDVLITTPESLFLILTSAARQMLQTVETVIIDEIHAMAATKRGAHLAVSLARIDHLLEQPAQRIGLSATVAPVSEVARFLAGGRPVTVVSPPSAKEWDLQVRVPVPDMSELADGPAARPVEDDGDPASTRSIWPHVEAALAQLIASHRSTIVFANSRRIAERLTARLNELADGAGPESLAAGRPPAEIMAQAGATTGAPAVLARAHHGSVSKEQRALIEADLKAGRLPAVVATSSMELGIDMGAVELVVQVEAPPSVAAGLQRVGRAGHQVGAVSKGVLFPKYRSDLLSCAVTVQRMRAGQIEELSVPSNPLDVAAQQIVACLALEPWDAGELLSLLRSCAPFAGMTDAVYESVLDMLAGRYPSESFSELRPRIVWDRVTGKLQSRPGAQRLAVTSGGTIPDRGLFGVYLVGGSRVGELDEEMVYESRVGDVFALGASSWRIAEITHERVLVTPAPGQPGRLPFWHGDALGRPAELGRAIGQFSRRTAAEDPAVASSMLADAGLDPYAVDNLLRYLAEQVAATGEVPSDRTIIVERSRDELGDWRVVVLSPWGARVHAPWALMIADGLREAYGIDPQVMASDDGIIARLPDTESFGNLADLHPILFPDPDSVRASVTALVGGSALFAARFRECAARSLLLPRRSPGRRAPLWQQRQRAAQLLSIVAEHPDFPIVLETVREVIQDVYDLPALEGVLAQVAARKVRVVDVETAVASPFASSLLFEYVANFMYEGDSPLAERRAQALTLDPQLLRQLLGESDLRELLDPEVIDQVVAVLQRLEPDWFPRDAEGAIELLWRLGPLDAVELSRRGAELGWLTELEASRRAFRSRIAGREVWVAVEDAARVRDAIGAPLPPGLPDAFLDPLADPLADLCLRYARTHGPFSAEDLAGWLGIGVRQAHAVLDRLTASGKVETGGFLPGGSGQEWCAPEVLRMIRRRTVAALREMAEPVERRALGPFLASWQHVAPDTQLRGATGLEEIVSQLAGVELPAEQLDLGILDLRVDGYAPAQLDQLMTSGLVRWTGVAGPNEPRILLAPTDLSDLIFPPPREPDPGSLAFDVLTLLRSGGAFFADQVLSRILESRPETSMAELTEAIWELVWAGCLTNDSLTALRERVGSSTKGRNPPKAQPGAGIPPLRGRALTRRRLSLPTASVRIGNQSGSTGRVQVPRDLVGRWSAIPRPEVDPGLRNAVQVQSLAERYGIVTRSIVAGEAVPGGFAALYRTLCAFEETGALVRSYAIEGLGAAQFSVPGVIDALRAVTLADLSSFDRPEAVSAVRADRDSVARRTLVLAAADPANPYGAALSWPDSSGAGRASRRAGAWVVLVDGVLLLHLERGGRSLLTFSDPNLGDPSPGDHAPAKSEVMTAACRALAEAIRVGRVPNRRLRRINGLDALRPELDPTMKAVVDALVEAGYSSGPQGLKVRLARPGAAGVERGTRSGLGR